jgi:poly(A) polymerase
MSEKYKVFETQEVMQLRTKSIQHLQDIVETWYKMIGVEKKGMDP